MSEIDAYLGPGPVIDRVNNLIGINTTNPGVEAVEGAAKVYQGFEYVSKIQRLRTKRGVTAYKADHRINASNLWERGETPDTILKQTHSLVAIDNGEIVALEASTLATYAVENDWLGEDVVEEDSKETPELKKVELQGYDIHLVRGGLVFEPGAIPQKERARMVKLFNL